MRGCALYTLKSRPRQSTAVKAERYNARVYRWLNGTVQRYPGWHLAVCCCCCCVRAYPTRAAACRPVQARVCVRTLDCVSHLDFRCERGVVTKDVGTRGPAGEGDEAQLGIIKPSTVSAKGPSSRAGPGVPQTEQLGLRLATPQFPLAVFPDQRGEEKKKEKKEKAQIRQRLSSGNVSG